MQQCYEKNLKYCKLAFFTQTDICLTYMQGLSKRPIPGAGAPGIRLDYYLFCQIFSRLLNKSFIQYCVFG